MVSRVKELVEDYVGFVIPSTNETLQKCVSLINLKHRTKSHSIINVSL